VICNGFLKLESLDFFETPSPNEIVWEKFGAKRSDNALVAFCCIRSRNFVATRRLLSLHAA
jgi:hypothetical protein